MFSLISDARAQDVIGGATQAGGLESFIPLILIVVVFFFMIIRPQQKRYKEHQNMVDALRRGDKVVTSGGVLGVIKKAEEGAEVLEVEISEGVVVKVMRSTITSVVTRSTEAASDVSEKKHANNNSNKKKAS